jgi:hypothetical protein
VSRESFHKAALGDTNWRQLAENRKEDNEGLIQQINKLEDRCKGGDDVLLGLLGLIQLLSNNADIPEQVRNDMLTSHRYVDALRFNAIDWRK